MDHLSSMTLDELELGGLTTPPPQLVREHLASCARCAGDLAELRADRAAFDRDVFARTLPGVERSSRRRRWRWLLSPALVAATLGILLVARPENDLTVKGRSPTCEVFAHRSGRVFAVKDGAALTPGDEIRFVVRPAGYQHVLVASIDSRAFATVYAPYGAAQSLKLASPVDRAELPGSVRLDATPGPERLYCLFSQRPIDAAPVLAWLRKLGSGGPEALRNPPQPALQSVVSVSALMEKVVP